MGQVITAMENGKIFQMKDLITREFMLPLFTAVIVGVASGWMASQVSIAQQEIRIGALEKNQALVLDWRFQAESRQAVLMDRTATLDKKIDLLISLIKVSNKERGE